MAKDHRVTLTKRHAYRTISNRIKTIKTPGMFSLPKKITDFIVKNN